MPEFLERRFSPTARWYLSIVSVAAYIMTKISVTIAAGGIVFETLMGINFWYGAIAVVLITGMYTLLGGLRAVLYTDFIQIFVIIGGAALVTFIGLDKLGGWGEMRRIAGPGFMSMWKPASDPNFPWTGIVFGVPIIGIWYWCTDQFIVQRVLSAKNIDHARAGSLFGGLLKLLPLFVFVIPGVLAYCLSQKGLLVLEKPDQALPAMVGQLLPAGLRGLVVAGLLAALTSSLASVFNSCSTLVTLDIFRKIKPESSQKTLVLVGRISTLVLIFLGLLWIPVMKKISSEIYQYLQSVQAYISPPVAAVFLFGILWKRINGKGAVAALFFGFFLGMGRLILEINKDMLPPTGLIRWFVEINFLHCGILLFVLCSIVLVGVSLLTKPMSEEQLLGMTLQTPRSDQKPERGHLGLMIGVSVVIMLLVALVWIYFSPWIEN
jgi:SSS family solute:Na+ symporter